MTDRTYGLELGFAPYTVELLDRRWLSTRAFELVLSKPPGFTFHPGQLLRFYYEDVERDYSLTSAPDDPILSFCIRHLKGGVFSPVLAAAPIGTTFQVYGPLGYFIFRHSARPAVFVATGVGIAPFVSMARSGVRGFTLLHGVKSRENLFFADLFRENADLYVPCVTGISPEEAEAENIFPGRVTDYLAEHTPAGVSDFYLCGRREMVRDVTLIVDEHYPGSFVYTEIFF